MIILDNRCGSLSSAHKLKNCKQTALNEGSATIYKKNVLTDIVVVKLWDELIKIVAVHPESVLQKTLQYICRFKNKVNIHLFIVGNKDIFLNKCKSSNTLGLAKLNEYLTNLSSVNVVECINAAFAADYILELDELPAVKPVVELELEPEQEPVVEPEPEPESEPEPEPTAPLSIIAVKEDNIEDDEDNTEVQYSMDDLLVQAWTAIPGITNKISPGLSATTTISNLPKATPQELSAVQYDTGTRFGVSRSRKLIDVSKDPETFKKILSILPEITLEQINEITTEYNISDVVDNIETLIEKHGKHMINLKVLALKK
jgi:hypothetical protein